jgi:hypothetical protein
MQIFTALENFSFISSAVGNCEWTAARRQVQGLIAWLQVKIQWMRVYATGADVAQVHRLHKVG